jgi:hypothetical protein
MFCILDFTRLQVNTYSSPTKRNPIASFPQSHAVPAHIIPHNFSSKRHALLDLGNSQRRVQSLGARPRAIENSVAAVQAHAVVKRVLALGHFLVARVGDPAVRLQEHGGAEVFFLVPPVGGARGGAAGAENAFVEAVKFLAVFLGLAVLAALYDVSEERWRGE